MHIARSRRGADWFGNTASDMCAWPFGRTQVNFFVSVPGPVRSGRTEEAVVVVTDRDAERGALLLENTVGALANVTVGLLPSVYA